MYEVAALYLAVVAMLIVGNWRRGLTLVVLTTIIQDPLRKLAPDQPVAFSLMAGVVAIMTFVVSLRSPRTRYMRPDSSREYRELKAAAMLFVGIIALQSINGFMWHGSLAAVALGIVTYLGALPAILVGRHLAGISGEKAMMGFLKAYLILCVPAVATLYLQYAGVGWPILGDVGQGIQIYDVILNGAPVSTSSGLFRSSEIAAWHIGACCCFAIMLATHRNVSMRSLATTTALVAVLLALGLLTGRRKLLIQLAMFLFAYLFLIFFIGRMGSRLWIAVSVSVAAIWLGARSLQELAPSDVVYRQFVARGETGFSSVGDRFAKLGIDPLSWAYDRFGPFGGGVGAATSGAQNYGVDAMMVAVGEGGLGKLAGELGWPGLAAAFWLSVLLARYVLKITRRTARLSPAAGRLRCGMAAFLIANISSFSVATQVFNDLFVLTTLGLFVGVLVSQTPESAGVDKEARAPQAQSPDSICVQA